MEQLEKLKQALLGLLTYLKAKGSNPIPVIVPTEKKSLLIPLANAIKSFEGFYPGSTSYRCNNPGNMRYSKYCVDLGAVGKSPANFAIFPDYQTGFNALCQFIKDAASDQLAMGHNLTLKTFMYKYAPPEENSTDNYISFLERSLGVSKDVPLKTII